MAGWTPDDLSYSSSIYFEEVRYRAGAISSAAMRHVREAWLAREEPHAAALGIERNLVWYLAYALPAATPADGVDALAALPAYSPLLTPSMRTANIEERIGGAKLLASDVQGAVGHLRHAVGMCTPILYPFQVVWAEAHLGDALAMQGDVRGACAAYKAVLARWGSARPRSVTADATRLRAKVLACTGRE
jgi:serine/threonine-protein kinase